MTETAFRRSDWEKGKMDGLRWTPPLEFPSTTELLREERDRALAIYVVDASVVVQYAIASGAGIRLQ